jgi:hypothetical protein
MFCWSFKSQTMALKHQLGIYWRLLVHTLGDLVMEWWSEGVMECRSKGVMECRSKGVMENHGVVWVAIVWWCRNGNVSNAKYTPNKSSNVYIRPNYLSITQLGDYILCHNSLFLTNYGNDTVIPFHSIQLHGGQSSHFKNVTVLIYRPRLHTNS